LSVENDLQIFSAESAVRLSPAKSDVELSTLVKDLRLILAEGRIRRFAVEVQEPVIRIHVMSRSVLPHSSLLDEMNDRAGCQPGVTYIAIVREHR
jgi:hypothetical protein